MKNMALNQEASRLYNDHKVRDLIHKSRNEATSHYKNVKLKGGEIAELRREGHYPVVTNEGRFDATLLRVIPTKSENRSRGGEFRVLANEKVEQGSEAKVKIVLECIPIFLKELSDEQVQMKLAKTRTEISQAETPAFLVQTRASDIHDGEYRDTWDGQSDLREEVWYAQVLQIMELFPGMPFLKAASIFVKLKKDLYASDFGLGVEAVIHHYYSGKEPEDLETEVLDGSNFINSFPDESNPFVQDNWDIDEVIENYHEEIQDALAKVTEENYENIRIDEKDYELRTLASYPIMQSGVKFQVKLIMARDPDGVSFQTFRVLQYGDISDAYVRVDSICTNGVQGGDTHCECRQQSEAEKQRAASGIPMMLINVRDDEGRFHGEGDKGGTLNLQRMILEQLRTEVGNAVAAQLYYHETGKLVDARSYELTQALLKYLGVNKIAHLVTDNVRKIDAISEVAEIEEVVTAEVLALSSEARKTIQEKAGGGIPGVPYLYNNQS